MSQLNLYGVTIKGVGAALPPTVVTNDDLSQIVDTDDEWIRSRSGFKQRRFLQGDETVTDLSIAAAKDALAYAGMQGEDIDLIIHASGTSESVYPCSASVVQHAIGASKAFGFDISMACSGLIYALGIASQFIQTGKAKNVLIVAGDAHSRFVDWTDRSTCVLFGDGAGAFVVSRQEEGKPSDLHYLDLYLDGSRGCQLALPNNRPNAPMVKPRSEEALMKTGMVTMQGKSVFKFAVEDVLGLIRQGVEKSGFQPHEIDYYVMHQANYRILDAMAERFTLSKEQVIINLENYGNTSAASIPLAMVDAVKDGRIQPGKRLLFCGFGAGLAVATAIVDWHAVDHRVNNSDATALSTPVVSCL